MSQFKYKEYPISGITIFWEGDPVDWAFLVMEGELNIISKRVPVNVSVMIGSDY